MWQAMKTGFKKYAVFRGRSDQDLFERFFMFQILALGIGMGILILVSLLGKTVPGSTVFLILAGLSSIFLNLYGLVLFLPSAGMIVRRLHDCNRSGWWLGGWMLIQILAIVASTILTISQMDPGVSREENMRAMQDSMSFTYLFFAPSMVLTYTILYFLAQPSNIGTNRFGDASSAVIEDAADGTASTPPPKLAWCWQNMILAIGLAWKQNWYRFDSKGRMSRSEYWCFQIPLGIIPVTAQILFPSLFFPFPEGIISKLSEHPMQGGIALLFAILLTWLSVAAAIRRLHDINYRGWWFLLSFIMPLGLLAPIYLFFKPSTIGDNRFGPQPQPVL